MSLFATMAHIRRIAGMMVPGSYADTTEVIGPCKHCGKNVTYAQGDTDAAGAARHDVCERGELSREDATVAADLVFHRALAEVHLFPELRNLAITAVRKMPKDFGPRHMLEALDSIIAAAFLCMVPLDRKSILLASLRDARRTIWSH